MSTMKATRHCCLCCSYSTVDDEPAVPVYVDEPAVPVYVTFDEGKATVVWHGEGKFAPCMEEFFDRVRSGLRGNKSKFNFGKWRKDHVPVDATVVIVVPQVTRLGIDVDQALEEIKAQISSNEITQVILVLHNQAPHITAVHPSEDQLTEEKYGYLRAILDLQIHDGKMRRTPGNDKTTKRLSDVLLEQLKKTSPKRPLIDKGEGDQ